MSINFTVSEDSIRELRQKFADHESSEAIGLAINHLHDLLKEVRRIDYGLLRQSENIRRLLEQDESLPHRRYGQSPITREAQGYEKLRLSREERVGIAATYLALIEGIAKDPNVFNHIRFGSVRFDTGVTAESEGA